MKTLLFLTVVFCFLSRNLDAQIQTQTIDGKSYYVYPHQYKVTNDYNFYFPFVNSKEVIQRDSLNQKILSTSIEPLSVKDQLTAKRYGDIPRKSKRIFQKMVDNDTTLYFFGNNISFATEPTPALQSLPDGEYVMYYRDIPFVKNRVLCFKNNLVAATFSIKNNLITGDSKWYNTEGQLIMSGKYQNSEKEGTWKRFDYTRLFDSETSSKKRENEFLNNPDTYDTTVTFLDFKNGLKNGQLLVLKNRDTIEIGEYKNNIESGHWERYSFKEKLTFDKKGNPQITTTDEKFLFEQFTLRSDSTRGKSILLRSGVIPYEYMDYESAIDTLVLNNSYTVPSSILEDEYYDETDFPDFSSFYKLLTEDPSLELDEEELASYEGMEIEEPYIDEYGYETSTIQINKKKYTTNELIDSIGYLYKYEGVFERYYANGQLQFRLEIKDGQLQGETPVYWDNGTIANAITFDTDSNQYVESFYDYNNVKYFEKRYDSKGELILSSLNKLTNQILIQGREYEQSYGNATYSYFSTKALKTDTVSERVLVGEELFKIDSSIAAQMWYYPQTRTLKTEMQNILHEDVSIEEVVFSEDFKNIHISILSGFDNLQLQSIRNGFLNEDYLEYLTDSVKKYYLITNWDRYYSGESDYDLSVDGKLFTGKLNIKTNQNKYKVKANDKEIRIAIPNQKKDFKLYEKSVAKYLKKGKKNKLLAGYNMYVAGYNWLSRTVLQLFPMLYGDIAYADDYTNYSFDGKKTKFESEDKHKTKTLVAESLTGSFLNGKAQNKWTYTDKRGTVTSVIYYEKGLEHGEQLNYAYALPKEKEKTNDYSYLRSDSPIEKYKNYPPKKTYYLNSINTYKNGQYDGVSVSFDWNGDTLAYSNYVNGLAEGKYFERNQLFYSESYTKNGMLEGKSKTYLTIPGKDSVLLFNLNFSNNLLQGESVAYHTNGNIAKKGFFLTGQPIDDYQAFDSLGSIYQYVKFKYNQPIEEKIWEENELSVRYLFDWRDSLNFNFGDITSSTSVNRLLYDVGYTDNALNKPYYGRPSLINKTGVSYEITKYYPNDTIARTGTVTKGIKTGCWKYYNYSGKNLYEVEYFDTIIKINDSISFKSKGVLYYLDKNDNPLSKSYIIEKFEKFDCSKTDHTEERMLYCFWEKDSLQHRINGYVKNYYDNGALQNEGYVKNGLPTGVWKLYDSNGNLSQVGEYVQGKRNGRWLKGDLSKIKNMSEICLNPNTENVEEILKYQANLLDIYVITYKIGKELKSTYFGINQNSGDAPDDYYEEEIY